MKHPILLLTVLPLAPQDALHVVESPKPAGKPNLLLIVTDDMGYGDATCYWKTDLQTPVIDGIARRGIRFTQFRRSDVSVCNRATALRAQDGGGGV